MLQAKKKFWGKKPGFDWGDVLHIAVNLIFATVIYAMVRFWNLAPLAVVLVILSKWRILAVQPRFWLPNLKANLVDIIVGISTVVLIFQAPQEWIALIWAGLYTLWLLFLKPKSVDFWVGLQAFIAQFIGLLALFMIPSLLKLPLIIVALAWLVSWAVARHYFSNYEEPHYRALGLIWGFLTAQLVWVGLHWIQFYEVFDMRISVLALIIAIISASLGSIYHTYKRASLQKGILLENALFAGVLLAVLLATAPWSVQI